MLKLQKKGRDIFHISFEIALILKAINGLIEIIGGVLLVFVNSNYLNRIISYLAQGELTEDPKDFIANTIIQLSRDFSDSTLRFGIVYLISHGLIKLLLVVLLWKRKIWAYPLTIIFLTVFIAYQAYRYTTNASVMMILLSVLDVVVIILTFIEYQKQRRLVHITTEQ